MAGENFPINALLGSPLELNLEDCQAPLSLQIVEAIYYVIVAALGSQARS